MEEGSTPLETHHLVLFKGQRRGDPSVVSHRANKSVRRVCIGQWQYEELTKVGYVTGRRNNEAPHPVCPLVKVIKRAKLMSTMLASYF